jgi:hypothetical protein
MTMLFAPKEKQRIEEEKERIKKFQNVAWYNNSVSLDTEKNGLLTIHTRGLQSLSDTLSIQLCTNDVDFASRMTAPVTPGKFTVLCKVSIDQIEAAKLAIFEIYYRNFLEAEYSVNDEEPIQVK